MQNGTNFLILVQDQFQYAHDVIDVISKSHLWAWFVDLPYLTMLPSCFNGKYFSNLNFYVVCENVQMISGSQMSVVVQLRMKIVWQWGKLNKSNVPHHLLLMLILSHDGINATKTFHWHLMLLFNKHFNLINITPRTKQWSVHSGVAHAHVNLYFSFQLTVIMLK